MNVFSVAAGLALIIAPAAALHAKSVTYNKPNMNTCYEAANSGRHDARSMTACHNALRSEMLTGAESAATLVNRGIMLLRANDVAGAKADFEAALRLDPEQGEAWLGKGIVEWQSGNSQAAFQPLDRAIKLRPRRLAVAYYVRGLANEQQGNLRAAYADLVRAQALDPRWADPASQLQRYRLARGS
jgi:tetratricopeptide (TPR) repeat protein